MSLYSYKYRKNTRQRKILTAFSYLSIFFGSVFLFWSFYPVIAFEIYSKIFINNDFQTPLSNEKSISLEKSEIVGGSNYVFSTNLVDYTKASYWFPTIEQTESEKAADNPANMSLVDKIDKYYLDIPKINIDNAVVYVGGEDLLKGLVHYLPKSLPGEYGNISIFGHSSLPQLHHKGDPRHIFTYLPTLSKGDKIYLKIDDLKYEYQVFDILIVKPDQVSVLQQRYDNSYLTLITCVPLGTYWKRLIVKAKLTSLPK